MPTPHGHPPEGNRRGPLSYLTQQSAIESHAAIDDNLAVLHELAGHSSGLDIADTGGGEFHEPLILLDSRGDDL